MDLEIELSPDSSFNINKWPETNKNKKSKYLMKDVPPMIDLTKHASATPKPIGNKNSYSLQPGILSPEMSSDDFVPFVQERDKLSRIIRVADKSMKQSDKMSPSSYRRQMKALIGN